MQPITENDIRSSFINTSRKNASQANIPDLAEVDFAQLEYLGWHDEGRAGTAYVSVWIDDNLVTLALRKAEYTGRKRKGICAWCQDAIATNPVSFFVARRAGASGRNGNTLGTMICTDFGCSANARRLPTLTETMGQSEAEREWTRSQRISGLSERVDKFVRSLAS